MSNLKICIWNENLGLITGDAREKNTLRYSAHIYFSTPTNLVKVFFHWLRELSLSNDLDYALLYSHIYHKELYWKFLSLFFHKPFTELFKLESKALEEEECEFRQDTFDKWKYDLANPKRPQNFDSRKINFVILVNSNEKKTYEPEIQRLLRQSRFNKIFFS